ncbi:MAG: TadE/TadG family type IV pilus assembly protein, partial [Hyphomicrobium sp.]
MQIRQNSIIRSSASNTSGSVAPIFGLLATPMLFLAGVSIDYSRAINMDYSMQNALDLAALAAMRNTPMDSD